MQSSNIFLCMAEGDMDDSCFHRSGQQANINPINTVLLLKLCKWCRPHKMAVATILQQHNLEMGCSYFLCYDKKRRKKYDCSTEVILTKAPCRIGPNRLVMWQWQKSAWNRTLSCEIVWLWEQQQPLGPLLPSSGSGHTYVTTMWERCMGGGGGHCLP